MEFVKHFRELPYTKRYIIIVSILFLLSVAIFLYFKTKADNIQIPTVVSISNEATPWWNEHYTYRSEINVVNNHEKNIFILNHASLVVNLKSSSSGYDLKIIGNTDSSFIEVPFEVANIDQIETQITFDPGLYQAEKYYLYYGNKVANQKNFSEVERHSEIKNIATLKNEEVPSLTISNVKTWSIKEGQNTKINLNFKKSDELQLKKLKYFFKIDSRKNVTEFNLGDSNIAEIQIDDVGVGSHELFVVAKDSTGQTFRSNTITIIVSAPVYVAITSTWAGVDVDDLNLGRISSVAQDFSFPITHFFSPRIFINVKIPTWRRTELKDWILERQNSFQDEIALGLFMQHDMVLEAGVKPKDRIEGWDKEMRGYDTPGTLYSESEYEKILIWALEQFSKNGLPKPNGFRAGGWFANTDTLKAIENLNFLYDSSAIKPFKIGQTDMVQPWTTDFGTQPYFPNEKDQNKNGEMKLLEIPTNGGSLEWLSESEVIANFYVNYKIEEIPTSSKIIVYSIHPEWFSTEEENLRALLKEINNYSYDLDRGPVKFITLGEYLSVR
jgi:hypothetical protein